MLDYLQQLWDFHIWVVIAALGALTAAFSIWADRRRSKRKQMERIGYIPWTGISMLAIGVTLISLALALKAG